MKIAKLVGALLLLSSLSSWGGPAAVPTEVQAFLAKRESCDHWRGEPGYDEERQKDIDWSICQSCRGTDAELARLKRKYRRNAPVTATLAAFEPRIEPDDKVAAARRCQATRKPDGEP